MHRVEQTACAAWHRPETSKLSVRLANQIAGGTAGRSAVEGTASGKGIGRNQHNEREQSPDVTDPKTLDELGVSKKQSSDWQKLAGVSATRGGKYPDADDWSRALRRFSQLSLRHGGANCQGEARTPSIVFFARGLSRWTTISMRFRSTRETRIRL
jgi:hypothetical protein